MAVDYCEFVPLHDDVFKMETRFEPIDDPQPAKVDISALVEDARRRGGADSTLGP